VQVLQAVEKLLYKICALYRLRDLRELFEDFRKKVMNEYRAGIYGLNEVIK
jgi:hypothetical protein